MEGISLEEVRADAKYTISLIDRAFPNLDEEDALFEADQASDEIDALVAGVKELYEDHCLEEGLPANQETYCDYVTGEIFSKRQERLLHTIELYHLLNFADRYCAEQPNTSLAKTFKHYANAENTTRLREFIEYDLKDLKSGLPDNPEDKTRDTVAKRLTVQKCEGELNKVTLDISDANAQTVQFGIDTVAAYTISNVAGELEFAAAVAIDSATNHHESFQARKKYLSELLQHLGKISDGMIDEPKWKDGEPVPMAGRSHVLN